MSRRRRMVTLSALALLGLATLVAGAVLSLLHTSYGQGQVRRYVQSWVNGKASGTIYIGNISGGFFSSVTVDSVEIRDESDSVFFASGPVTIRYDARDLLDRRILLSHLDVQRPYVHLKELPAGDWNYQRIFPSGPEELPSTARGFGDFIVMDSADIRDATVLLTLPWRPPDTLRGYKRDSAIAHALASRTRTEPGNQWRSEIRRAGAGFERTYRFTDLASSLGYSRIADRDSVGQAFVIRQARVRSSDPPIEVRRAQGLVKIVGDSVLLDIARFQLPGSSGRAEGRLFWGSDLPLRYDVRIAAHSVSLRDVAWVYPTLPTTGGGRLDLQITNVRDPHVMDYVVSRMDVRTTGSRLLGSMTYGVGGPVLAVKNVDVSVAPLDFDLIRALSGGPFPFDWQGRFTGSVRAAGGPLNRFRVDEARFSFADANVRGAVTRGTARGELDILEPAFTVFRGLDVNVETLDLRTLKYLSPAFPQLRGTVAGVARLDSSWLDVRFSRADLVHRDADAPASRVTGSGRMTWGDPLLIFDVDLNAAPVSMTALARSYPDLALRGSFTGPIRVIGTAPALRLTTTLTGDAGTISFDGLVDSELPTYGARGTGSFANADLRSLLENPAAPRTSLTGEYVLDFAGDSILSGTGSLRTSFSGGFERVTVSSGLANVRLSGGVAHIDTLLVRSPEGHASATGSLALLDSTEGRLSFSVSVDSLADVRRYLVAATPITSDSLRGAVRITGEIAGTPGTLVLNGTVAGREIFAQGRRIERLSGEFSLADVTGNPTGHAAIQADTVNTGALRFSRVSATADLDSTGLASFDAALISDNGVHTTLKGTAQRGDGDTTRVSLDSARVSVSDGASYQLEAPARIVLLPGGGSLDSLLLRYRDARLVLRDLRLDGDSVRGNVRTENVDLSIVEAFLPGVQQARGALVANLDVIGTVQQPLIKGHFSISSGSAAVGDLGLNLQRLNADIVLSRDTLFVRHLSAETQRERRGNVAVDGYVALDDYRNPFFGLRARAESFRIIDKPGLASLDISTERELTLTGPYTGATVTGAVRVDRGTVSIPELITKKVVDLSDPELAGLVDTLLAGDRKLMPSAPGEFARHLVLDNVEITVGDNVWLRSSEANVKLGGSLNVTLGRNGQTGEESQLALEGTLNAERGTYRLILVDPFVQPTFDVESGSLRFFGSPDLNPTLDIRAIHTIRQPRQRSANLRDIRVRVTIGGTLERPVLALDNPDNLPLSQSDLLSYLITGEPALALDNTENPYASQLASVALRYGGNLLTSAIPRNVVDIVELQTAGVNLNSGGGDPYYYNLLNTRAILGKQIGNQWFLGLSTGLCVVNATNFIENFGVKLEYRFNSIYSAQAGIEPGSSDYSCARVNAPQIQQQTPRQLGVDFFRSWRF